jgi:uncharacterized protein YeaC (DUF1315 family)
MTIELTEDQKDLLNRILEIHEKKKSQKDQSREIFFEAQILSMKNELMKSLGFKRYMTLLKETAPLFY